MQAALTPPPDRSKLVRAYHERTKHRFEAYAAGPSTLDWDAQPAAFRHYTGASVFPLPVLAGLPDEHPLRAALMRPFSAWAQGEPQAPTLDALGVLLNLAFGITAWKRMGPDRWAVRANPSSGNLHPIEAYLLLRGGIAGLADGVYHYDPLDHVLSLRASFASPSDQPALALGLSAVMWREAWKYGERAFRYCQLDCGHALGAARVAAAALGWGAAQLPLPQLELATLLGIDRSADFPGRAATEREEAEALLGFAAPGLTMLDAAAWRTAVTKAHWHGTASPIDRHPMFRWPVIDVVAEASRRAESSPVVAPADAQTPVAAMECLPGAQRPLGAVILGRRSAQRFDSSHVMPQAMLRELVATVSLRAGAPWDVLVGPPRVALLLIVHRVEGLASGVYLLPRSPRQYEELRAALPDKLALQPTAELPGVYFLAGVEAQPLKRTARSLHCHQDIAATACVALGMLARFDDELLQDPAAYRDLLREAGLIGQMLYLHAESRGLRGTGIGCYFDDPVHEFVGLPDQRYQSLYHFTVGLPLDDARIETAAPYPHRTTRTFP